MAANIAHWWVSHYLRRLGVSPSDAAFDAVCAELLESAESNPEDARFEARSLVEALEARGLADRLGDYLDRLAEDAVLARSDASQLYPAIATLFSIPSASVDRARERIALRRAEKELEQLQYLPVAVGTALDRLDIGCPDATLAASCRRAFLRGCAADPRGRTLLRLYRARAGAGRAIEIDEALTYDERPRSLVERRPDERQLAL